MGLQGNGAASPSDQDFNTTWQLKNFCLTRISVVPRWVQTVNVAIFIEAVIISTTQDDNIVSVPKDVPVPVTPKLRPPTVTVIPPANPTCGGPKDRGSTDCVVGAPQLRYSHIQFLVSVALTVAASRRH